MTLLNVTVTKRLLFLFSNEKNVWMQLPEMTTKGVSLSGLRLSQPP